jgi:8-oxo-dGTP pyrophosphatase MutT (NUDIX family)
MKTCDNASVGILIRDDQGRYLMFDRNTFPAGVAPAAGHVFDDHPGYPEAAHAEVAEELGLTVVELELAKAGGWRDNRCRRAPGPRGVGHQWQVFTATVTGDLSPSQRETRNVRWLTAQDLQALADRTADHASGWLGTEQFAQHPGIEPVWVRFLVDLGIVTMPDPYLDLIEKLAGGAP